MAGEFKYIEQGFAISSITNTIYETTKAEVEPDAGAAGRYGSGRPWARWGTDNNYPQRLIDNIMSDAHASLMERRRSMHWGQGLMFCNIEVDDNGVEKVKLIPSTKVPKEITDFFRRNKWNHFQQGLIADYEWWTSAPVQYIFNNAGNVIQVKWQRRKDVRAELRNEKTGKIDHHYISGSWPDPQTSEVAKIPAIDIEDDDSNISGIYVHELPSIDKDYYVQPGWHGINKPLQVGGKIWRWINANIDNSINFKYHIEIPLSYFLEKCPVEAYKTDAERMEAISKLEADTYKKIDDYLAGEKNVHKAFYTKFACDEQGKPLAGWKINTLENKIQDEAWLRAYGMASMAIVSGIGLNPSLAGITLPNGLGSGSGSDLREQFNFAMQTLFPQGRSITLEPWEFIKRRNKWPEEIHLRYRDVVLQSVDQNKSGFTKQNEQSPTSDKDPMKV